MKRILKILFILILILSFCTAFVNASDINLNLPTADTNTQNNANEQIENNEDAVCS